MRAAFIYLSLGALTVLGLSAAGAQTPADDSSDDEAILRDAKVGTAGPALLEFFRTRTPGEAELARIGGLIRELGSGTYRAREKATAALIRIGTPALAELRRAERNSDAEVRNRARRCVAAIESDAAATTASAAARLLRVRKPPGTCAVLLKFLPFADGEGVQEEIQATLVAVGVEHGRADPALEPALDDPNPARRAAAALVLGRSGSPAQRQTVRGLLKDRDPIVRLRAAQGLVAARDKSAVPALVGLVGQGPSDAADEAEDLLARLAGKDAPRSADEKDPPRAKRYEAWAAWWKTRQADLDLTHADVDLAWIDWAPRARAAATRFLTAITKPDLAALKALSTVPFFEEDREIKTIQELHQMLDTQLARGGPPPGTLKFKVTDVVAGRELAQDVPDQLPGLRARIRRPDARAALVEVSIDGRTEHGVVLLTRAGGGVRVFGIIEGRHMKRKK